MVTKTEESELNNLEIQVDNGGGGAWEYLSLVRKLKQRRSGKVLKHGLSILNDSKLRSNLGPEEWSLYEQVVVAAMDCQCVDVAQDCAKVLRKRFPESKRVGRLEAMLLEAKGSWEMAEKAYTSLLEDNPLDQTIHKRRVAMAKAQGNISGAIEWLNKYLEIFMADDDAWRELAEVYLSLQMYKQAAFCYEEVILAQPTVPLYHLAYADVLYTLGGLENVQTAKKYYASAIDLTGGKNTRALFGICLCTSAIAQLTKGKAKKKLRRPKMQYPREPDTSVEVFENLSPRVQACIPDLLKVDLTCLDNVADSDGSLRALRAKTSSFIANNAKLQEFLGRKELDRHLDTDEAIVIAAATVAAATARWTTHGLHPLCTLLPTIYFYPSIC
ncbi:unnamed protein product [Vicia faba]|uniref:ER membrane protein complex subunit 2 n=1 Tax=Vicia faba TaxID=3906 RepID=A0AAV0ZMC4_VICFA|nr:unnamed protein product [Vicia faba]